MKKFSETQPPKQELETDRYELKEGLLMIITDIAIIPSKKYEHIGKINGYDLVTKNILKYRTTSKSLIDQMENMIRLVGVNEAGKLKEEIKVGVKKEKSREGPYYYLTFYDP